MSFFVKNFMMFMYSFGKNPQDYIIPFVAIAIA